jgi:hypothetical protein
MLQRLPQYVVYAGVGMLGGVIGVDLAISLWIAVQSLLSPAVRFAPGIVGITIATTLAGVGISWLLSRIARRLLSNLFDRLDEQGVQIILVFGVLTSLLQTFLFTRNF